MSETDLYFHIIVLNFCTLNHVCNHVFENLQTKLILNAAKPKRIVLFVNKFSPGI